MRKTKKETVKCVGCGQTFISNVCHKRKYCSVKCFHQNHSYVTGGKHWNWRGGRSVLKSGYVYKKAEGHPRATTYGYVFEHILVMEKHIGRYISYPNECVHHLNGNKGDNRIENLELLTESDHHKKHKPTNSFKKNYKASAEHRRKNSLAKKKWWKEKKRNGTYSNKYKTYRVL